MQKEEIMRYLKLFYEADIENTKMEKSLIFLLKAFGWNIHATNWDHQSIPSRFLLFQKRDN